jgi:hypothetical protein
MDKSVTGGWERGKKNDWNLGKKGARVIFGAWRESTPRQRRGDGSPESLMQADNFVNLGRRSGSLKKVNVEKSDTVIPVNAILRDRAPSNVFCEIDCASFGRLALSCIGAGFEFDQL